MERILRRVRSRSGVEALHHTPGFVYWLQVRCERVIIATQLSASVWLLSYQRACLHAAELHAHAMIYGVGGE
jgi:hypothetical protein